MTAFDEAFWRLASFAAALAAFGLAESLWPRRHRRLPRVLRWSGNFGIAAINVLLLRLILPVSIVGFALLAQQRGWGLFNLVGLPVWMEIVLCVVALDFVVWAQHAIFHRVPALWRLHRMHHADTEFDISTGVRFHPVEIFLSALIKLAVVALLGAPPIAVIIFEILLNATAMFNHANLALPQGLDRILRLFVVTPDMHRVHHSIHADEHNTNFGFNLPWWDYLFRTYCAQPRDSHEGMMIGLGKFRAPKESLIDKMITQPFRNGP